VVILAIMAMKVKQKNKGHGTISKGVPRVKRATLKKAPQKQLGTASSGIANAGIHGTVKRRNNDPGVRHQSGRIYDSENGTTCHQCRQKTIDVKACCTSKGCNMKFCSRCLSNRYSEKVDAVRKKKQWACPKCRNICNCSSCRKKKGLQATGVLATIAKSAGFGGVSELLERNPNMIGHHSARARKENVKQPARPQSGKHPFAQNFKGVDDSKLKRKRQSMPDPIELKIHQSGNGRDVVSLPHGVDRCKLICVLEFFATFGATLELKFDDFLGKIAKDIVSSNNASKCPTLNKALAKIKKVVCEWFGDDNGLPVDFWFVDRYLKAGDVARRSETSHIRPRSFWTLESSERLDIVFDAVHDSLQCGPIVDVIEQRVDGADDDRCRYYKQELDSIKRVIRQEQDRHTQQYIAELISSQQINNLSMEQQQQIVNQARSSSVAAVSDENKSRLRWLKNSEYLRTSPSVRMMAIGQDRHGTLYYSLNCAKTITGTEKGILRLSKDDIQCFNDIGGLQNALDMSGEHEGALRMALMQVEKMKDSNMFITYTNI